jgi:hypothetical protein
MNRFLLTTIPILLSCCVSVVAYGKAWRGIVPLQSKRADVERLLGEGTNGHYQFERERIHVEYAGDGTCHPVNGCLCLVSKDTVISIYVQLEVEMSFSKLKIDKKKYERYAGPQDPTIATFSNEEEGIIYTVDEKNDDVIAIEYIPAAKDCNDLLKAGRVGRQAEAGAHGTGSFKFDEYGAISEDEEKARLDDLAFQLRSSDWLGYIIAYDGPSNGSKTAYARGERAKAYLMQKGVDGKRVFVVDGGRREELTIELFATIPGTIPPSPRPTIP